MGFFSPAIDSQEAAQGQAAFPFITLLSFWLHSPVPSFLSLLRSVKAESRPSSGGVKNSPISQPRGPPHTNRRHYGLSLPYSPKQSRPATPQRERGPLGKEPLSVRKKSSSAFRALNSSQPKRTRRRVRFNKKTNRNPSTPAALLAPYRDYRDSTAISRLSRQPRSRRPRRPGPALPLSPRSRPPLPRSPRWRRRLTPPPPRHPAARPHLGLDGACRALSRSRSALGLAGPRLPGSGRGLGLAGEGEVGELELGALRVGAEQLGLLRVQEGEGLRAGAVRFHAHGGGGGEEKRRFRALPPPRPGRASRSPGAALR